MTQPQDIRRNANGSIDVNYYMARGRDCRGQEFRRVMALIFDALRRPVLATAKALRQRRAVFARTTAIPQI